MNTNDRGQNLAEARHFKASQAARHRPIHRGYPAPDPRCACAGTGFVADGVAVIPCPEHVLATAVPAPAASDPRGARTVDWEAVAGRAMCELQAAATELKRLRGEMPAALMAKYDRRFHPSA